MHFVLNIQVQNSMVTHHEFRVYCIRYLRRDLVFLFTQTLERMNREIDYCPRNTAMYTVTPGDGCPIFCTS